MSADDHGHDEDRHTHDGEGRLHVHERGGHTHHHAPPADPGRAFVLGIALNVAFIVAEVIAGVVARSTALLADAAHNVGDVLGLGMAWGALILSKRKRSVRRTYGLRRTTILAGLANAVLILIAVGGVTWEAIRRIGEPAHVEGGIMAVVATIGVFVNGGAALLFARGRERDVNLRGAFLHLVADAAVSAGVVVAGLIVIATGWNWVDPATSIVISLVIVFSTFRLFREALDLLLDAVPAHIDPVAVEAFLAGLPGVQGVHDLHIWPMSTTAVALTAHLVVGGDEDSPTFVSDAAHEIEIRFGITHATLQLEPADPAVVCAQPGRCI